MKFDYRISIFEEMHKKLEESDAKNELFTVGELQKMGSLLEDLINCNYYMLDGLNLEKGSVVVGDRNILATLNGNHHKCFSLALNPDLLIIYTVDDEEDRSKFYVQISRDKNTLRLNINYFIEKDLITVDYFRKSSDSEFGDVDMKLYLNYVDAVKNKDDSSIIICDYHYKTSLKYEKNYLNYIILRANEFYSRCLENENNLNVTERRGK